MEMSFNINIKHFILHLLLVIILCSNPCQSKDRMFPVHSLNVHCRHQVAVVSEDMDFYLSFNRGSSWENVGLPDNKLLMTYFASCSKTQNDHSIIASNGNEIFQLRNRQEWTKLQTPNEMWQSFTGDDELLTIFAIAMRKGIYVSPDRGRTWRLAFSDESQLWSKIVCDNKGKVSMGISLNGGLILSRDYGKTFLPVMIADAASHWADIAMSRDSRVMILAESNRVYRSLNQGDSWDIVHVMPEEGGVESRRWRTVVCSSHGNVIALLSTESKLYISIDYGREWTVATAIKSERWSSIAIDEAGEWLYGATDTSLYLSNDHGRSWTISTAITSTSTSEHSMLKHVSSVEESLFTMNGVDLSEASFEPSVEPTGSISTEPPSSFPSFEPTMSPSTGQPSLLPTVSPSTRQPTLFPTILPTISPTLLPTVSPSTVEPSLLPTLTPTLLPTREPWSTHIPTTAPSRTPSLKPTRRPTFQQTTIQPTVPTATLYPTRAPTEQAFPVFQMETYLSIGNVYGTTLTPAAIEALLSTLSAVLQISKEYLRYLGIRSFIPSQAVTKSVNNLRHNQWMTAGANISYSLVAVTSINIPLINYYAASDLQPNIQNLTQQIYRNLSTVLVQSISSNQFVDLLQYQAQLANASDFDYVSIQQVNFTALTLQLPPTASPTAAPRRSKPLPALSVGEIIGIIIGCLIFLLAVLYYYRKKLRKCWRKRVKRAAQVMSLEDLGLSRYDPVEFYMIQSTPSKEWMSSAKFEDVYNAEQRPKKSKSMTKSLLKMAAEERKLDKVPDTFSKIKMKPFSKGDNHDNHPHRKYFTEEDGGNEVVLGLDLAENENRNLMIEANYLTEEHVPPPIGPESPLASSLKKSTTTIVNPKMDRIEIEL